jgi:ABC-type sugar transport system ATPase subunit
MLDGRIAQVGVPTDVFANPVSAAVASFLGL